MKILVICQYYYPEPFRITDVCEALVKRNHDVTVVTGLPNYPMGQIYAGYRNGEKRDEVLNGVKVHRCFTIGRRTGVIYRFLNYYSFACSSSMYTNKLGADYDVVLVNQLSPVMMANAGIRYKNKHNKKMLLYCLDLWPESLVAGGIKRDSVIYKLFNKVSEKIYKQADKILVTSQSFSDYFKKEFGIEKTEYLPQYAETIFTPELCKKERNETIDLMFAGNVGAAQSVDTIIRAAALTKDIKNLRWHIVGDGSELGNLKRLGKELDINNVIFHGRKPLDEMPKYYAVADAMLVTMQKDEVLSLTLPGKVQTYMAAGKPILGAIDGETRRVISESGCGLCCDAEDFNRFGDLIRRFCNSDAREQMAINAKEYYFANFSKNLFMVSLNEELSRTAT